MDMNMEMAAAVEDDLFYADLRNRISLLIAEDDDEELIVKGPVGAPLQAHNYAFQPLFAPSPYFYDTSYRRETKGTGVFIPKSSLPKKKNRSGRSKHNSDKSRAAATAPTTTATRP